MKLYRIYRDGHVDYDEYDSAVVAAPDEDTARNMSPRNGEPIDWSKDRSYYDWVAAPEMVRVELIGYAAPHITQGVIVSSFNAG